MEKQDTQRLDNANNFNLPLVFPLHLICFRCSLNKFNITLSLVIPLLTVTVTKQQHVETG